MEVGNAFLKVDRITSDHLWIVIAKSSESVAIVNLTSRSSLSHDDTCIIKAGEHPFVVHDTIIYYQQALIVEDAQLESVKRPGLLEMRESVSPELLRRIQEGALASPFTPQKVQAAVKEILSSD